MAKHARQVLARVDDLLRRACSHRAHLLRTTILLADMADHDIMNGAWNRWLADVPTLVRATYGVGSAVPRHAIEVIVMAARPPSQAL